MPPSLKAPFAQIMQRRAGKRNSAQSVDSIGVDESFHTARDRDDHETASSSRTSTPRSSSTVEEMTGELGVLFRSISEFDEALSDGEDYEVIAKVTSTSLESIYGHPMQAQKAKAMFPLTGDSGLVYHATLIPDAFIVNGKLRRGLLRNDFDTEKNVVKPRRATLPVTQGDFFSSLTKMEGENRWVFHGVLNGWPALKNMEVLSLERKREGSLASPKEILTGQLIWMQHWESPVLPGDSTTSNVNQSKQSDKSPAEIADPHCIYRVKLRCPPWSVRGYSKTSPGFVFWFQPHHPGGPRVDYGSKMPPKVGDGICTMVHMFSHRYAMPRESPRDVLTYHSVVVLEWDHGEFCTVVEAAFLNGMGGYKGRSNWYHDKNDPVTQLYKALPPEMVAPWLTSAAEIRCFDVEAKTFDEFQAYVDLYKGHEKRFVDPHFTFSHPSRLTFRSRSHIGQYLVNYIQRDSSYSELKRNCQTLAADLCGFLAGKKGVEPFHPINKGQYRNRTHMFLYDSSMYEKK